MTLLEVIKSRALEARKSKDVVRANLLTTLYSEASLIGKNKNRETTDEEVQKVARKFHKNLEASEAIKSSDKNREEIKILKEFKPDLLQDLIDVTDVHPIIDMLIERNPDKWASCKENDKNIGWFVGQTMKATGGKANPATINSILVERMLNG